MSTPQIWAVGRNYADHAKELGNKVPATQGDPMIFLKGGGSIVEEGKVICLPTWSNDVHHELEIALQFGSDLRFSHFTLALDLTARDVQAKLKEQSYPWTLAKSFQNSCPMGRPQPLSKLPGGIEGLAKLKFSLKVNGELRQSGSPAQMIFSPETLREFILARLPVLPGDWLLTGTPAGVARLKKGDRLEANIEGFYTASWSVE